MLRIELSHTSHSQAQTGIQRVVRAFWREMCPPAEPICYDPYLQDWRHLEPWEIENLRTTTAASRRRAHWPLSARLRGRIGRLCSRGPKLPAGPSSLLCPEIFSPTVARALPALFAKISGPRAALIHDVIPLQFPELTPPSIVGRFPAYLQELLRFDAIATVSEESREAILGYWRWLGVTGTPPIELIALGADQPAPLGSGNRQVFVNRSENLTVSATGSDAIPVILCVSTLEGRKNHLALLEACERLWAQGRQFELRLIGIPRPETAQAALTRIAALQSAGRTLRFDGAVDERVLEEGYAAATFTVYPSLIEGSGLPVRESLTRGKPCICSGHGALGEVARGGGCLMLEALDAESIAAGIDRLLQHPAELAAIAAAAAARPRRNWADVSRDLTAWIGTIKRRG